MANALFSGTYINEKEGKSYPTGTPSPGYDATGKVIAAVPGTPVKRSKYINPATGKYFQSPQEYGNYVATKIPVATDVPKYAGEATTNPDQSVIQLQSTARNLNNARNDIAVGATDPYKAGNKSGIAYSPQELSAIEKAYAGIYDPALNDVFARLKTKQDEETAAADAKQKLELLAQQHKYDLEMAAQNNAYDIALKKTPTYAETNVSSTNSAGRWVDDPDNPNASVWQEGTYISGEDPVVDSYVERVNRGEMTVSEVMRSIPGVKNQSLRDAVSMGLNSTRYESAKTLGSLDTINKINKLLTNPQLNRISGTIEQYTGGMWGEAKTAKTIYDQIAAQLQVQGAALSKGQGQISDYERTIFKDAALGVNRGMGDKEFRKALVDMRGALSVASGLTAPTKLTDPATKESKTYNLTREQIIQAEKDGFMVEFTE